MAWYRTGTITVTNGSAAITGAGTAFVDNVQVGHALVAPDGRSYEIAQILSATQLVLASNYQGATAAGQAYAIQPTSSFARDLALAAATLINAFGAIRDGVGQGLFADGTMAAPAIRFAADQDSGLRRVAENSVALVTAGADRLIVRATGEVSVPGLLRGDVVTFRAGPTPAEPAFAYMPTSNSLGLGTNGAERVRIDPDGNLLVGTIARECHAMVRAAAAGAPVLDVFSSTTNTLTARFFAATDSGWSSTAAAVWVGKSTTTARAINAGGTINAAGADYAEYMVKADGCGTIAPGDVCGVDAEGKLTRSWADAVSWVIKSTDPAYVGGDSWSAQLPRPEGPGRAPVAPVAPGPMPEEDDEAGMSAWQAAVVAYPRALADYRTALDIWSEADAAHAAALVAWEADLEAARRTVDRIAFCGQVPVNLAGDFAVGDYLIAAANGGGIQAVAIPAGEITFEQYRRRLGKVWAIRGGRPWIDVQHG